MVYWWKLQHKSGTTSTVEDQKTQPSYNARQVKVPTTKSLTGRRARQQLEGSRRNVSTANVVCRGICESALR